MIVWMTNKFDWFYSQKMLDLGDSAITSFEHEASVTYY